MKLSCADYTWPAVRHGTAMSIVTDLGFTGIDLGIFGDDTHVKLSAVLEDPAGEAARVSRMAAAVGLAIADVFLIPSPDLRRWPRISGPSSTGGFPRVLHKDARVCYRPRRSRSDGLAGSLFCRRHNRAGHCACSRGLGSQGRTSPVFRLGAFGGRPRRIVRRDSSALYRAARANPGLNATLDPAHYAYAGFSASDLKPLLARTRHVQVRPCGTGVMQGRMPDNTFDFESLVSDLKSSDYKGWIATEFVWMEKWSCDRVDNTSETARLKHYLSEILQRTGL